MTGCAPSCGLDRLREAFAGAIARRGDDPRAQRYVTSGGCSAFVAEQLRGTLYRVPLGRSLPFAAGLAASHRGPAPFVFLGDGETAGPAAHSLLHASRRGDPVRAIVVNNQVTQETGGFPSPTTPRSGRTAAQPSGSPLAALDLAGIARSGGAAWVGRETLDGGENLDRLIEEFVSAPTFAFLEILAPCYPAYGQWNEFPTPEAMRASLERSVIRGAIGGAEAEAVEPGVRVGRLWPREG